MADDISVLPSSAVGAAPVATHYDGTAHWPGGTVAFVTGGSPGAWTLQSVDATHGLPVAVVGAVAVTGTFWQATQPVSIAGNQAANVAQYGGADVGAANALHVQPGTGAVFAASQSGAWTVALRHGAKASTAAAPTTAAAQCLAANAGRIRATIVNAGTQTVYLGPASVATSTGIPLVAGAAMEDAESTDAWYAVTASGTGDLRIIEVS